MKKMKPEMKTKIRKFSTKYEKKKKKKKKKNAMRKCAIRARILV